ncbi:MAG: hypothetical protein LBU23_12365 [Planctomycetota bacterium]|jgi:hypothetical protein|nr:hypothetical protein [Planctomycetota bacterium]
MKMLREFCRYFMSVMMGRRSSLTAFIEPLTMAERYLRWGLETRDIRDFRSAMDHLHLCYDRDAPMASLLIRKYSAISDVGNAAIETLLQRQQKVVVDAAKTESDYRDELEAINRKVAELKVYIRRLRDEGSLIKAKNEESHMAELEANAKKVLEKLDSGEGRTEVFDSYDDITSDAVRFFRELDHASTMIMANPMLGPQKAGAISSHLLSRLEFLRNAVEKADPVKDRPAGKEEKPSPGRSAGGKKAGG